MTGAAPQRGRCALCRRTGPVFCHTSVRDGLKRLVCTRCYSRACLVEAAGRAVDWPPGRLEDDAAEAGRWWLDGAL